MPGSKSMGDGGGHRQDTRRETMRTGLDWSTLMRVLHLGKYFPPSCLGGVETVTQQLAEGMTRRGVQSDVLCFEPGEPASEEQWDGFRVIRAATPLVAASTPLSLDFVRRLARMAPDYDILHVHCPNPMAALALRLTAPAQKIVLHWHSDVIRQKYFNRVYRFALGNWLARRVDAVVGATPAHVEASEYSSLFRGKSHVIPFCLDPAPFAPDLVNQAALDRLRSRYPGKKAVFSLGRLISYKGFDVLIEAAALLHPDWVVLIGGTGPLQADLEARIAGLGLSDRVSLLGRIPEAELSAHYHFSRVFCLPSVTRAEMYGMVQLEAMACGRPIVSTRIPGSGVADVNLDGITGLTVTPGDPATLAQAIHAVDADQARWEAMSAGCLAASRERFAPEVMLSATHRLYEKLLS